MVRNVEAPHFTGGADTSLRGTLARLAGAASGEASDLLGTDRLLDALEKGATLEQVAGMLLAASGMDRLDHAAFVDTLYRNVPHRDADAAGRGFWIAALEEGAASRAGMAAMVAGSGEKLGMAHTRELDFNQGEVATLVRMYATLFDRKADADGLNFWIGVYESGKSLASIADAFVASGEAQGRYAAFDNDEFVAYLYLSAFGRVATAGELAFWTGGLDRGTVDRGDVLPGFANSDEEIALVGSIGTSIQTA